MNIEKLNTSYSIKTPNDLFGELAAPQKESLDSLLAEHTEAIEALRDYKKAFFNLIKSWAYDAIENNTYDQQLPYRLKLTISVQSEEGTTFFLLENTKKIKLFFSQLTAYGFEGYLWMDKIEIKRTDGTIQTGVVEYYGTHGATETFAIKGQQRTMKLIAKEFAVGDVITIETIKYSSTEQFTQYLYRTQTVVTKPIPSYEKLTLTGQAHWSARGELESPAWNWWFEIKGADISDEKMKLVLLEKETGVGFIKEIKPYFPILLVDLMSPRYIAAPSGIPGGTWDLSLPLKDCKNPEAAEKIFRRYFPLLCEYL